MFDRGTSDPAGYSADGIGKRAERVFWRTALRRSGIVQVSPHAVQRT